MHNITILHGTVMHMFFVIIEGNCGAIDDYDYTCHSYYIIKISSSQYTLQADLNIYIQVISSGEMVCEGTYYFPININFHYHVYPKTKKHNCIYEDNIQWQW